VSEPPGKKNPGSAPSRNLVANTNRLKKLKWRCRRGMKELDVMLERFLARHEQQLNAGAWPELETLLQAEDDRLWDWLLHPDQPDGLQFNELLHGIRDGTARRH